MCVEERELRATTDSAPVIGFQLTSIKCARLIATALDTEKENTWNIEAGAEGRRHGLAAHIDQTKPQYQQSGDTQRGRASYTSPARLGNIRSDDKPRFMLRMAGLLPSRH
jgi:hypothetical protein